MINIAAEIDAALVESYEQMLERITAVKYDGFERGCDKITFLFDNKPMAALLRGRNRDYVLGYGETTDKRVAAATIFTKDAHEVSK